MEDYEEAVMLKSCGVLLVVTSTWGDGEPPSNAESLYLSLKDSSEDLSDIQYAVYALGDETFDRFCQAGKDFDQFLNRCGAKRLLPIRTCGDDYDSDFPEWLDELIPLLSK